MILLPPHFWNSFNKYHFSIFIHVHTVFAPYSLSHTLSPPPSPSLWYQPPKVGPVLSSCSLVLQMKTKWHLYLFKIITHEVSLWYFHVPMYYNPNLFISSSFLLSTLILLWWFLQVWKFYIHSWIESTLVICDLLNVGREYILTHSVSTLSLW
jgi:hypothetical protein